MMNLHVSRSKKRRGGATLQVTLPSMHRDFGASYAVRWDADTRSYVAKNGVRIKFARPTTVQPKE